MKKMTFSVEINASRKKVWNTLWADETFRQWAGLVDPGTYMVGELKEGNEVQFISAENGYGVTSLVEEVKVGEYLRMLHQADTKETGTQERDNEWTGGAETYTLSEKDGITTLTSVFDVPEQMEEMFKGLYPRAFERVKELAEKQ